VWAADALSHQPVAPVYVYATTYVCHIRMIYRIPNTRFIGAQHSRPKEHPGHKRPTISGRVFLSGPPSSALLLSFSCKVIFSEPVGDDLTKSNLCLALLMSGNQRGVPKFDWCPGEADEVWK
jgi:hypothetical protein